MTASKIEWTEHTWNPVVGCSLATPGCTNCYAMKMAARIEAMGLPHYEGLTRKVNGNVVWTGKLASAPDSIWLAPLRRKKPTTYFVNSMGDLFHENCPDAWIDRAFAIMALCPQHTFQVLTKRSERMRAYLSDPRQHNRMELVAEEIRPSEGSPWSPKWVLPRVLPNVWLGVSAERQQEADARIPDLLNTPAAVRFVSCEPLLGPIDLTKIAAPKDPTEPDADWRFSALDTGDYYWSASDGPYREAKLDWVIVGGESGRDARDNDFLTNARSLFEQCQTAGVPFFGKQNVGKAPLPTDLQLREYPRQ